MAISSSSFARHYGWGVATPSPTPPPLTNFDYAVLRYSWDINGGTDLDTRTALTNTGGPLDNLLLGWCKNGTSGGVDGGANGAIVGPPGSTPESGPYYLFWGGDNTTSLGNEAVLLDFPQIATDFPSLAQIEIELRAFWFNIRNSGNFIITFTTYLGGTMQRSGYDFINVGGTVVDNIGLEFNSNMNIPACVSGQCFKHLLYTVATKSAILIECPPGPPPPVADFTITPNPDVTPITPTTVLTFTSTSTSSTPIEAYRWVVKNQANVVWTTDFRQTWTNTFIPNQYTATLTVANASGASTISKTFTVVP